MQSKKAREVIIWIVVIGMVLGLLFSVLAALAKVHARTAIYLIVKLNLFLIDVYDEQL